MIGISSSGKESINRVVEDIFDKIALQLIGDIPKLKYKKLLLISSQPNYGLANLFVQAMANKTPNAIEQDALKSLLESSHGYIESLKNKTRSNVTERIDGLVKEAKARRQSLTESQVEDVIQEELSKARSHLKAIVEAESTKLRNVGSAMDISRVAASVGDDDPTVFFVVVRDGKLCDECQKLHLNDKGTPRVWKFSELKQGYHKRGEEHPSAFGLHPHCRCTLTYLSQGFGFDKHGKVTFKSPDHNEFHRQRTA
jgi:hypothetical protein